jgi:hypothetical protein
MKIHVNVYSSRGLPCLKRSQIRLLVYKDHDKRGDKFVLFDSKTDVQDDTTDKVCLVRAGIDCEEYNTPF